MTIQVSDVLELLTRETNDFDYADFSEANWLEWLNDAQRAVLLVRPDARTSVEKWQLAAGTKQSLPTGHRRLLSLGRNMGGDGSTPGKTITGPISKDHLDTYSPDWHKTASHAVEISHYMYNEANPTTFYVYPGAKADVGGNLVYVEGEVTKDPEELDAAGDNIDVPDIYVPALVDWCLYRAWSCDSDRSPNWQMAGRKFANFFNLLQVKLQSDLAISPKIIEKDAQLGLIGGGDPSLMMPLPEPRSRSRDG